LKYLALLIRFLIRFGGKLLIDAKKGISMYFEIGLLSAGGINWKLQKFALREWKAKKKFS
jgi:hypothetical protein